MVVKKKSTAIFAWVLVLSIVTLGVMTGGAGCASKQKMLEKQRGRGHPGSGGSLSGPAGIYPGPERIPQSGSDLSG